MLDGEVLTHDGATMEAKFVIGGGDVASRSKWTHPSGHAWQSPFNAGACEAKLYEVTMSGLRRGLSIVCGGDLAVP